MLYDHEPNFRVQTYKIMMKTLLGKASFFLMILSAKNLPILKKRLFFKVVTWSSKGKFLTSSLQEDL